jgi:hypothetical protein
MEKRFTPQEVRQISETLSDQGIRRMGFLLLGSPGETKPSVKESLMFADSLRLSQYPLYSVRKFLLQRLNCIP